MVYSGLTFFFYDHQLLPKLRVLSHLQLKLQKVYTNYLFLPFYSPPLSRIRAEIISTINETTPPAKIPDLNPVGDIIEPIIKNAKISLSMSYTNLAKFSRCFLLSFILC